MKTILHVMLSLFLIHSDLIAQLPEVVLVDPDGIVNLEAVPLPVPSDALNCFPAFVGQDVSESDDRISIRPSRSSTTAYYIDGVMVEGAIAQPQAAYQEVLCVEVIDQESGAPVPYANVRLYRDGMFDREVPIRTSPVFLSFQAHPVMCF